MTSAVTLAAEFLNTTVAYSDYLKYNKERRKPVAGTEYPVFLEKPASVLGEIEQEKALNLLGRYDYNGALYMGMSWQILPELLGAGLVLLAVDASCWSLIL